MVDWKPRFEILLQRLLETQAEPLATPMQYAVLGAGKRFRPHLVYATAQALGMPLERVDSIACAIELVHAYSLIHDDLPALDNDDLRRGKPSCHKRFGEAMTILCGDALQSLSFRLLARRLCPAIAAERQLLVIAIFADAIGIDGMAGGQAIECALERAADISLLERLQRQKTGSLITAAVLMAAQLKALPEDVLQGLQGYAEALGLCFQRVDDLADRVADKQQKRPNFALFADRDKAVADIRHWQQQALNSLSKSGLKADSLRHIACSLYP